MSVALGACRVVWFTSGDNVDVGLSPDSGTPVLLWHGFCPIHDQYTVTCITNKYWKQLP